jgi:pimeloyl-ACP methyl ester carboxylesterase
MTINFTRRGSGPSLVLIHGIGHRWQAWEPVLDALAEHHDVIALDLPGFGESPIPPEGMPRNMNDTVIAVGAFFKRLDLQQPHVAGNSLGGAIALELAAAGVIASATAFSPAGFFTEAERMYAVRTLGFMRATTFQPPALLRLALKQPMVRAQSFGRLVAHPERLSPERAFGDTMALRRGRGFRAVVKSSKGYSYNGEPTVPVTVAWGAHDRILPLGQADRARERLPQARHVTLPNCGHIPMSDAPELVAQTVLETTGAVPADLWSQA